MGSICCSHDPNDSAITGFMRAEAKNSNERTLLLLGAGSTGKSTLFRSLQSVHNGGIEDVDLMAMCPFIRNNVMDAIRTLVNKANALYDMNPDKYGECFIDKDDNAISSHLDMISENNVGVDAGFFDSQTLDWEQMRKVSSSISFLWNLDCIQATFHNRGKHFAFEDNLDYFLDNVNMVFSKEYIPSEQDYLKTKERTIGMIDYTYVSPQPNNPEFRIIDVGGQRSDRPKWLKLFDGVDGLIFVAALSDYNAVLFEDNKVNSMLEAANLFENTINKTEFEQSTMVLILNKDDIFVNKLRNEKIPLSVCFSKEGNWPNEDEYFYDDPDLETFEKFSENTVEANQLFENYHALCIEFIFNMFKNRNQVERRMFHRHVTTATTKRIVQHVFNSVQILVVSSNLHNAQLLDMSNHFAPTNKNKNKNNNNRKNDKRKANKRRMSNNNKKENTENTENTENKESKENNENKENKETKEKKESKANKLSETIRNSIINSKESRIPKLESGEPLPSATSSVIKENQNGDHEVITP